jgi:cyclopropane-fatty-acyl-phospholipid synthase
MFEGLLGAGESYMDGWWDCEALDEMVTRVLRADIDIDLLQPLSRATQLLCGCPIPQRGAGLRRRQAPLRHRRRPLRSNA